jgi:thiol:disulfide interchange protein
MVALAASQREVVDAAGSSDLLAGFQLAFQGAAIVAGFAAVFALVALRSASAEREVPVG